MRYFILLILVTFSITCNASWKEIDYDFQDLSKHEQNEVLCLAQNIYFESSTEPTDGKLAVGMVTMNRANSGNYPDTVCGVVKQKVKGTCQFSWYCDQAFKDKRWKILSSDKFKDIKQMAMYIYLRYPNVKDVSHGATHFHATRINPRWHDLKKTVRIGQHVFYKSKQT